MKLKLPLLMCVLLFVITCTSFSQGIGVALVNEVGQQKFIPIGKRVSCKHQGSSIPVVGTLEAVDSESVTVEGQQIPIKSIIAFGKKVRGSLGWGITLVSVGGTLALAAVSTTTTSTPCSNCTTTTTDEASGIRAPLIVASLAMVGGGIALMTSSQSFDTPSERRLIPIMKK